jgi:folate-dependent phosphoribosylglycinamide formyltransferase PurN
MNKIFIFSPNRYSLYTTTVTAMLIQHGLQVSAIYVRKLINPSRVISEFKRDGTRLLKKVWKKLFLRQAAYPDTNFENIISFRKKNNLSITKLDEFQTRYSIPVIYCSNLNDDVVIKGLQKTRPDLVVFTGGGLIRQEVLENSGNGVLNCHMGVLPLYRGMDVVEWPMLEGHFDQVGITVHFMDKGVDTGDILRVSHVQPNSNETITGLRDRIEPIMCQTLVDTCYDFLGGKIERHPQSKHAGKQYFKMHPHLAELAAGNLKVFQNRFTKEVLSE